MTLAVIGYQQPLPHQFIDSLVQSTDLATDLRGFVGGVVPSSDSGVTGTCVYVFGAAALGDGGAGLYYWHNTSTAIDDGFNVLKPGSIGGGSGGRWLRATPGGTATQLVTATGAVTVQSLWRIALWKPTTPAAATFSLPASPIDGEPHTIKYKLSSGVYALTVVPQGGGVTIDDQTDWVLNGPNDALSVRFSVPLNQWVVV